MINFKCSKCGELLEVPESIASEILECPNCKTKQNVPRVQPITNHSPTSIFAEYSIAFNLFWWIILPVIVIGIWAVFGAEQQSRIDAQYSIAGRPDPLKVEVSETKYTHAEYFIGSIKFIALMAILITGWRIEKQLVHLNNNVKSLQLNSVSTSRREN